MQGGTASAKGLHFKVSAKAQNELVDAIAQALQQAHDLGTQQGQSMIGTQEANLPRVAKDFVQKAKDIVTGVIKHTREAISNALNKNNSDEGDHLNPADVAQDTYQDLMDTLPDLNSETFVHGTVQQSVADVLRSNGKEMEWECEPDACDNCQHLAEQGAIGVDGEWEGGITSPPAHFRCRCRVGIAN
jgi:hypothetical protein